MMSLYILKRISLAFFSILLLANIFKLDNFFRLSLIESVICLAMPIMIIQAIKRKMLQYVVYLTQAEVTFFVSFNHNLLSLGFLITF
jgi:hypothetical protein